MCKLDNAKLPDYSIPDTFWTDSVSSLDKLTVMKRVMVAYKDSWL